MPMSMVFIGLRTYQLTHRCLLNEIASLVDKGNSAVEFRTFNILQQTEPRVKFCFIVYLSDIKG